MLAVLAIIPLAGAGRPLAAQQTTREQTIMWSAASSSRDGYIHGTAQFKWRPRICAGDLWIVHSLVSGSAIGHEGYWYRGVNYGLRSDFTPPPQPAGKFTVRIAIGAQTVKSVDVRPSANSSDGCYSAGNFIVAGPVKGFLKAGATAEDREALLDRVTVDLSVSHEPMRSEAVERTIRNELLAAAAKARRDSAELVRAQRAQRDSADRVRRAAAQTQRRDSIARDRQSGRQQASRDSATGSAAPSGVSADARAAAPAAESAETRADRARLAQQEAAAQRAAEAERVQENIRAQAAERQAADKRREEALVSTATTAATIAQGTGGAFGAYYLAMDAAPARSTSYTFEALSGLGLGLNWRFAYVDAGMVNATYTDNYTASARVEKEDQGYFVGGGLVLDLPASPSFSFGPTLGYTMVETANASTSGVHGGFLVRLGSLKFRYDIGSAEQNYYGIGAYLKF